MLKNIGNHSVLKSTLENATILERNISTSYTNQSNVNVFLSQKNCLTYENTKSVFSNNP